MVVTAIANLCLIYFRAKKFLSDVLYIHPRQIRDRRGSFCTRQCLLRSLQSSGGAIVLFSARVCCKVPRYYLVTCKQLKIYGQNAKRDTLAPCIRKCYFKTSKRLTNLIKTNYSNCIVPHHLESWIMSEVDARKSRMGVQSLQQLVVVLHIVQARQVPKL